METNITNEKINRIAADIADSYYMVAEEDSLYMEALFHFRERAMEMKQDVLEMMTNEDLSSMCEADISTMPLRTVCILSILCAQDVLKVLDASKQPAN